MICCREDSPAQTITWADPVEATEADRLLYGSRCSPGCQGIHSAVWATAADGLHVVGSVHNRPPRPATFREDLAAAYPRRKRYARPLDNTPELWCTPADFNEPLRHPIPTNPTPTTTRREAAP